MCECKEGETCGVETAAPLVDQSTDVTELYAALSKAQKEFKPVAKDSWNPHHESNYSSLDAGIAATRDALAENDLTVIQTFRQTPDGRVLTIITTLGHKSGQFVRSALDMYPTPTPPSYMLPTRYNNSEYPPKVKVEFTPELLATFKPTNQTIMGTATYGRRAGYYAILGIAPSGVDADDDGETGDGRGRNRPADQKKGRQGRSGGGQGKGSGRGRNSSGRGTGRSQGGKSRPPRQETAPVDAKTGGAAATGRKVDDAESALIALVGSHFEPDQAALFLEFADDEGLTETDKDSGVVSIIPKHAERMVKSFDQYVNDRFGDYLVMRQAVEQAGLTLTTFKAYMIEKEMIEPNRFKANPLAGLLAEGRQLLLESPAELKKTVEEWQKTAEE